MTGFLTIFQREIARFFKVLVQTVVTPFISSFLYLLIFGVSLGEQMAAHQGVSYIAFLIPGLMMMGLINNSFQNSSSSIVSSKFSGDLEDLRVAPVTDREIIWAMSLGALVRGSIVALITYTVGSVFMYYQRGEWLAIAHPFVTLFFIIIAGLIFGMIGISVAFWARTFDQLSAFSAFILLPLTYLGGVFLSIEHLHPFWQAVSKANPLLYLINGLRYGILGVSDVNVWTAAVISILGFVFFYAGAHFSLKRGSFQRW
ncbi:ABC transporter permease [Bdellovibrio bacteriovorus]|uniref:Transport permease protein n=1 Tax=Bdellovibrio bacteriovorus TaxID=959 RepID=A0A150WDY4_BDEBC|nr:ABC transporter permease [Bdellovibrio bacteriovorus]KYG61139.1 ABC transporter permease [Bdellovibrio bacteriovorus]